MLKTFDVLSLSVAEDDLAVVDADPTALGLPARLDAFAPMALMMCGVCPDCAWPEICCCC